MRRLPAILAATLLIVSVIAFDSVAQDTAASDSTSIATALASDIAENPLKPADTSSPRATLQSFIDNMNRSYRILMTAYRQNTEAPGIVTSESVTRMAREAEELFTRAVSCLDLSQVPSALRKETGYESTLQLKEVFDRIDLPPADLIPDADAAADEAGANATPRWNVPDTDIVIARVDTGPREGEYLFSPRTVAHADDFYAAVKDLPYKADKFTTQGFLEFYLTTPGWLMPPKWSEWLPVSSRRVFLTLTIWQWCSLVVSIVAWVLIVVVAFRMLVPGALLASPLSRSWKRALFCFITIATLSVVHVILRDHVNISGPVLVFLRVILLPVWWFLAGAMILFIASALAEAVIASPKIDPQGFQASYFRALFGVVGFIGAATVFAVGLSRIGVSLIPLLTGLGVGGLAVALAARPTLEGIISSFTIFADNPYRVGDRIAIMGQIGVVESIGLRSTRIRLLNGHVTTVPNEKMAASEVENIGRRPYIRRTFNITITYDTPPEQISRAVDILKEILAAPEAQDPPHPNAPINRSDFPPRVYFSEFNTDSLNLYVSYWYHPPEYWDYMEHAHWINMQIKQRFDAEGIDFAFPTQTVHLAGDKKRPLNLGHRQISDEKGL